MNKTLGVIVLIVVVVGGGYFLYRRAPQQPQQPAPAPQAASQEKTAGQEIIYTNAGFSPASISVKKGAVVVFKNQSSGSMWPASAMHPSHRVYGGTSLDEHCPDAAGAAFDACMGVPPGANWIFRFEKIGTWKYHDHLNPRAFGEVVVE